MTTELDMKAQGNAANGTVAHESPAKAKTIRTAQRKGDYVRQRVQHCDCEYQKEKTCGYGIFKWVGGRKSWKLMLTAASPGMAEVLAEDYKQVLIVCLGCGADMVRECVPNADFKDPAL